MTLKRIVLSVMTLLVLVVMGQSLISSLSQPQVGNQLQLYQTDLLVQASEWDGSGLPSAEVEQFRNAVFGKDALESASEQYLEVRQDAATGLKRLQQQADSAQGDQISLLRTAANSQQRLIDQIDVRLGMVQVQQNEVPKALKTWQRLASTADNSAGNSAGNSASGVLMAREAIAAQTLVDLWQTPPVLRPNTADLINLNLTGWFRYSALERLYTLEDKSAQLSELRADERAAAEKTLIQLSAVGLLPSFGALFGTALLIALIGQRLLRGKDSLLAIPEGQWDVPWNWEVIWQVIVGGFLFVGQFVVPLVIGVLLATVQSAGQVTSEGASGLIDGMALGDLTSHVAASLISLQASGLAMIGSVLGLSSRGKALYSLGSYLLMAAGTLTVLYYSVRAYLPLSKAWFPVKLGGKWPLWGFGSYLVALPLMLSVSLLNQQIWQGQGGNNPILQIVLDERDPLALGMFLFTAAVAAPVFEEILFRGFLLPSLTRYLPIWGAIGLSSLIFAAAHLSFSEVLPLTVLGSILGFAYVRSRNLLSSILLHSTWNSVTMIGLFLLGSGSR